jgi:hypothetical protein
MTGREAFAALDEELDKLAAIYREPLLCCYLQGLTRDEAALRLGIPSATLKSQLDRGRRKLAEALTKRGIVFGAGLIAVAATSAASASSPRLVSSILATVSGSPSATVAAFAQGVAMKGLLKKIALGITALVMTVSVGLGWNQVGQVVAQSKQDGPKPAVAVQTEKPTPAAAETLVPEVAKILVLGPDGKPAAGATIRRLNQDRLGAISEKMLGKTDAIGRFEA